MTRRTLAAVLSLVLCAGCLGDVGLGGPGLPQQRTGETYPGQRFETAGEIEQTDTGCLRILIDAVSRFVIWPAGSDLGDAVRLPDGSEARPGDRLRAVAALTPTDRLVADANGYWASVLGFCAPNDGFVLVIDEVDLDD